MSWAAAAGGRFKRETEVHTPQDVTATWNPVMNEMPLSLCLYCHKGKEAIHPMVCVVDLGIWNCAQCPGSVSDKGDAGWPPSWLFTVRRPRWQHRPWSERQLTDTFLFPSSL